MLVATLIAPPRVVAGALMAQKVGVAVLHMGEMAPTWIVMIDPPPAGSKVNISRAVKSPVYWTQCVTAFVVGWINNQRA